MNVLFSPWRDRRLTRLLTDRVDITAVGQKKKTIDVLRSQPVPFFFNVVYVLFFLSFS